METSHGNGQERLEKIERYLNGRLRNGDLAQFEQTLRQDPEMAQEVENVKITRSLIRSYGLREELKNIHAQALAERKRPLSGNVVQFAMRIAAGVLILLVGAFAIQLATVSDDNVFASHYNPYPMEVTRGDADQSSAVARQMKTDYMQGNYQKAITAYEKAAAPSVPTAFIAGNAYLALENAPKAIAAFMKVNELNAAQPTPQYAEATEYYLGLAHVKNNEPDKAQEIFSRIRQNPTHPYHEKVNGWFAWKLQLLRWKN